MAAVSAPSASFARNKNIAAVRLKPPSSRQTTRRGPWPLHQSRAPARAPVPPDARFPLHHSASAHSQGRQKCRFRLHIGLLAPRPWGNSSATHAVIIFAVQPFAIHRLAPSLDKDRMINHHIGCRKAVFENAALVRVSQEINDIFCSRIRSANSVIRDCPY
jgi:hypothetical protein